MATGLQTFFLFFLKLYLYIHIYTVYGTAGGFRVCLKGGKCYKGEKDVDDDDCDV